MLTKPAMLPSPEDPNYLEIVKISCFIPEDPVFTPTLNAKVHDKRFGGLREPLLGTAAIELKHYLPWVDKNRELIMKRHNLANTFRDAANRAGVMSKTTSAPRPTVSPADSNADDMFENEEKEPLVPPGGSDEPEPELEHAPEQSSIPRSVSSSFVSPENGSDDQEDVPPWREGRLIDGKILDNEWEDAMKQDRLKVTGAIDLCRPPCLTLCGAFLPNFGMGPCDHKLSLSHAVTHRRSNVAQRREISRSRQPSTMRLSGYRLTLGRCIGTPRPPLISCLVASVASVASGT